MISNLRQFLARQLNDHADSPSGVVQPTYTEWTEPHIADAIDLALCYVYSLMPQEFAKLEKFTVTQSTCVVDFDGVCGRFTGLVNLQIGADQCIPLFQMEDGQQYPEQSRTNSLLDMLGGACTPVQKSQNELTREQTYFWDEVDGSKSAVKFDKALPVGTIITYTCSTPPSIDGLDASELCQYHPLIADYALWWLFRADTESRSNLARADAHFRGVRDFVETKLLLEFSLKEDDFDYGRRQVPDE